MSYRLAPFCRIEYLEDGTSIIKSPGHDVLMSAKAKPVIVDLDRGVLDSPRGLARLVDLGIVLREVSATQEQLFRLENYFSKLGMHSRLLRKGASKEGAELEDYGYKMDKSYGWDADNDVAQLKAVVETYERVSTEFSQNENLLTELGNKSFGSELYQFQNWQYSLPGFRYGSVPSGLWVTANNPSDRASVSVPAELTFFNVPLNGCGPSSSSGVAAYSSYEEAVLRSAYELIERDALMTHWYRKRPPVRLNPGSLLGDHLARLRRLGFNISFFWLELGLAPVAMAILKSELYSYPSCIIGLGAAPNILDACWKALQEVEVNSTYLDHELPKLSQSSAIDSVMDHQYWYNQVENQEELEFFWNGPYADCVSIANGPSTINALNELIVNRKMEWVTVELNNDGFLETGLYVVRSFIRGIAPIGFGYHMEPLGSPRLIPQRSEDKPSLRITSEGYLPQPFA